MPGPQRHWVLHVGAQEQRPGNAVFTKLKNINNAHHAPPVVSIRPRCVQESKCVRLHAHTHALAALARDIARRRIIPARLQSILTNTVCVPSCPQQRGSCGRLSAFLPLVKDLGCFQQCGELGSRSPRVPALRGLAAAPRESEESDSQPGAFLTANSPLCALPSWCAAGDRGSG